MCVYTKGSVLLLFVIVLEVLSRHFRTRLPLVHASEFFLIDHSLENVKKFRRWQEGMKSRSLVRVNKGPGSSVVKCLAQTLQFIRRGR